MNTDSDRILAAQFATTAKLDFAGDWNDVIRRAHGRRSTPSRRIAIAAAMAVAGVVLTATLAFGGTLRDLFFGKPAPPPVKHAFAVQNETSLLMRRYLRAHGGGGDAWAPQIDASRAHGVIEVQTADGPLTLWAAPTVAGGRECWFVDFVADLRPGQKTAAGGGSCEERVAPPSKIQWSYGWTRSHPTLKELSGRLYVDASSLEVYSPGSAPRRIPVVHRYFLAAFPEAVRLPSRLVALDVRGHVVAIDRTHS